MAISGNISNQQGDSFLIETTVPIVGLIALSDFIDTTTGSFYKEFRYATDGINFTSWYELTADNLAAVSVQASDNFLIEYRYTNLLNSEATFTDIEVSGSFSSITCGKTYQASIFNEFFGCTNTEVLQWCINVTGKLYKDGIVAKYVTRGDEANINGIDRDYVDFWRTVACVFGYAVVFARQFQNFRTSERILDAYLESRGIIFCDSNTETEKNYLVEKFFDEIRQRGTNRIYKTKIENNSTVDGELLRSICYDTDDEFIFNLHLPHTVGWSVGNSSPLFRSLEGQEGVNKSYETTEDFVDLDLYPTFGNGTQAILTDGDKDVYSILNVPDTEIAGIGDNDTAFAINVDSGLDYEFCFFVRQPVAEANLTFGLLSYDIDNTPTTLNRISDAASTNNFFETVQLANTTDYFFVRGILYNKDANGGDIAGTGTIDSSGVTITGTGTSFTTELEVGDLIKADGQIKKILSITDNTSLSVDFAFDTDLSGEAFTYFDSNSKESSSFAGGVHLKSNASTTKVIPYIILDNTSGGDAVNELRIWDLKVRPVSTNYGTGFINPKNFISIWANHKNAKYSRNQLEEKIRRYLLPYDTSFKFNYLNDDFAISS